MSGTGRRVNVIAVLAAAMALWIVPQASAAVTSSSITSPGDPTFGLFDFDAPSSTFAISGASNGTAGDQVDLRCYHGSADSFFTVQSNVAVGAGGGFSVPAADLSTVPDAICRLRAVPAGTAQPESALSSFAATRLAIGERDGLPISSGPNVGTERDYYIYGQQLTAANDYDSYGSCGLCNGHLYTSDFTSTPFSTWGSNDYFPRLNVTATRSPVQVDGVNAYAPGAAQNINDQAAGFPPLTFSASQDPSNGDLTIQESQQLVSCPDPAFPPDSTSCPSFGGTGVTVNRTISQGQDGHLVFIKDTYASTDGKDHPLSLLPANVINFGNGVASNEYQFPGEGSPAVHHEGDSVSFPDGTPGAVFLAISGHASGDTTVGRGAIVFDRPSSPAAFDADNSFEFHQTALATPSCSPTLSFAYAQDYDAADVQTLAQMALDQFNGSPATTCSPTPPSGSGSNPPTSGPTGKRAAALKKCKKIKKKKKRKRCRKRAKRLPV